MRKNTAKKKQIYNHKLPPVMSILAKIKITVLSIFALVSLIDALISYAPAGYPLSHPDVMYIMTILSITFGICFVRTHTPLSIIVLIALVALVTFFNPIALSFAYVPLSFLITVTVMPRLLAMIVNCLAPYIGD